MKQLMILTLVLCDYAFDCLHGQTTEKAAKVDVQNNSVKMKIENLKARLRWNFMNPFQKSIKYSSRQWAWSVVTILDQLLALFGLVFVVSIQLPIIITTSRNQCYDILICSWIIFIDIVVLLLMIDTTFEYFLSVMYSQALSKMVQTFYKKHYGYKLSPSQYLPLYNPWFVCVIISNALIWTGTVLHLMSLSYTENHHFEDGKIISIYYIRMGVFLQSLALLRFLSYFNKYSISSIFEVVLPKILPPMKFLVSLMVFCLLICCCMWHLGSLCNLEDPLAVYKSMLHTIVFRRDKHTEVFIFTFFIFILPIPLFLMLVFASCFCIDIFIFFTSSTKILKKEWSIGSSFLWDFAHEGFDENRTRRRNAIHYLAQLDSGTRFDSVSTWAPLILDSNHYD